MAVFLTAGGSTKLILPRVSVIAVGSRTLVPSSGQATGTTQQSDVVTFGVTAAQAQTLIFAAVGRQPLSHVADGELLGPVAAADERHERHERRAIMSTPS